MVRDRHSDGAGGTMSNCVCVYVIHEQSGTACEYVQLGLDLRFGMRGSRSLRAIHMYVYL